MVIIIGDKRWMHRAGTCIRWWLAFEIYTQREIYHALRHLISMEVLIHIWVLGSFSWDIIMVWNPQYYSSEWRRIQLDRSIYNTSSVCVCASAIIPNCPPSLISLSFSYVMWLLEIWDEQFLLYGALSVFYSCIRRVPDSLNLKSSNNKLNELVFSNVNWKSVIP